MQSVKRKYEGEEDGDDSTLHKPGKDDTSVGVDLENSATTSKRDDVSSFKFSLVPSLEQIRQMQEDFVTERNWEQYHTPRNILLAMVGEVGELAELFQWRGEVGKGLPGWCEKEKFDLANELSDVLIYLVRLADRCQIDLPTAVINKFKQNAEKYPANKVYGSSKKYTHYQSNEDK